MTTIFLYQSYVTQLHCLFQLVSYFITGFSFILYVHWQLVSLFRVSFLLHLHVKRRSAKTRQSDPTSL